MTRRPRWNGSLLARLLVVVAIPMGALLWASLDRISHDHEVATSARAVLSDIELAQAASSVYTPANVERLGLQGLAYLDQHHVPRDAIADQTGLDFQKIYDDNRAELDQALDQLAAAIAANPRRGSAALTDNLRDVRSQIDQLRGLTVELRATTDTVRLVFERLELVLEDAAAGEETTGHGDLVAEEIALHAINAAISSAGEATEALSEGMLSGDPAQRRRAVDAVVVHEAHLATLFDALTPPDEVRLTEFLATNQLADRQQLEMVASTPTAGQLDAETLADTTDLVMHQLAYFEAFEDFVREYNRDVAERAQARAAASYHHAERTEWLLWGLLALSVACVVAVTFTTMRPLRRLTRRSSEIAAGRLALDPLPVTGPTDVRALIGTMNDMLATLRHVDAQVRQLADEEGDDTPVDLPGPIGIALRDSVQRLRQTTVRLQRSEQLASAIVAQAADAIWTTTLEGVVLSANQVSADLTGIAPEDQIGLDIDSLLSARVGHGTIAHHTGERVPVLVASRRIESDTEPILTINAHDMSERVRFEMELSVLARHDNLTGLPNRFAVIEYLAELTELRTPVTLLFIDLDGFKRVNDSQGHATGDRVLGMIASRLRQAVRQTAFVGRLGGDEFVVIGTGRVDEAEIDALTRRLIDEIELPCTVGHRTFVLSASVGVASSDGLTSGADLLHQADIAVYHAKRRGRGRVERFDEQLRKSVEHAADIELALRGAIRNDELLIHLQPIIDLETGRPTGAEALVRWNRPGVGLVPPAEFIPIAERSALIIDLERWVLHRACECVARWRDRDPDTPMRLSVNVSGRHLIEGDLLADLDDALGATGADPSMLEFELTETQLLADLDHAMTVLQALRGRGVEIAVDDFGTGYSSMTYLRHLPIDTIKIDRSFLSSATVNEYDATVVESVLRIGKTLGLTVVAEGIETVEQLDFVRARGCDRGQGFLLSPPLPVTEAEQRLDQLERTRVLTHS